MAFADDCLAELGVSDLDGFDRESTATFLELTGGLRNDAAREALVLRAAAQPIMRIALPLGDGKVPGSDVVCDATWAASAAIARRQVLCARSAGLNGRLAERNLRLLDRVCELVADWPEPDWSAAVRKRVNGLVEASRIGRARGEEYRRQRRHPEPRLPTVGWLLRHPGDKAFHRARPRPLDASLRACVDDWIADFEPSYAAMAAQDWSVEEDGADLVVELSLPGEVSLPWNQPIPTVVDATHRGDVAIGAELPLRLVADPDARGAPLVSVLSGERWRACATLRDDGSILPEDGTRRLEPATSRSRADAK